MNNRKRIFDQWVQTASCVPEHVKELSALSCPSCSAPALDYHYCGDRETSIGYGLFWCNACKNGLHLSRLKILDTVPEGKISYFDELEGAEDTSTCVPDFKHVTF
ncbi:hypothetical protein I6N96_15045 [Enterococcus sp. BWM-S5]|uniref:Uncharacterized protein n=1 Tax=Enterococcus larvae TaxID=2794352 RepID=A0ABS4CNN7_9ENTE|nr:hypothetical protein [Enterococcus larvae]MBP1047602.1 hypothetical protein [Enterococcus larvae]